HEQRDLGARERGRPLHWPSVGPTDIRVRDGGYRRETGAAPPVLIDPGRGSRSGGDRPLEPSTGRPASAGSCVGRADPPLTTRHSRDRAPAGRGRARADSGVTVPSRATRRRRRAWFVRRSTPCLVPTASTHEHLVLCTVRNAECITHDA